MGTSGRLRQAWLALAVVLTVCLTLSSCGGDSPAPTPTPTPPPTPPALALSCPADSSANSTDGKALVVNFTVPAPSGGTGPYTVTCVPASGTPFAVGKTTDSCTATDSQQRIATCTFTVTVTANAPKVTCPANVTVASVDGNGSFATFAAATVVGGTAPVSVSCTPASGSVFPVGTTSDTCTVTDAQQRTDSCSFTVTVRPPPQLNGVRFLAFGDSITAGEVSFNLYARMLLEVNRAYPALLRNLLATHYTAQSIVVDNAGVYGETAVEGAPRLSGGSGILMFSSYDAVLLLEGVNDLSEFGSAGAEPARNSLRAMARDARRHGSLVFLASLLPQRKEGTSAYVPELIAPFNDSLQGIASAEGAVYVDLYSAINQHLTEYIGSDGLHPTEEGYQRIAEVFLNSIQAHMERPGTGTLSTFQLRR